MFIQSQNHKGRISIHEFKTERMNYESLITKADVGHQLKNQHFILEHVNSHQFSLPRLALLYTLCSNQKDIYCCKIHCVTKQKFKIRLVIK